MRHIAIDYNKEKGSFNRYASLCVGAGRAGEALRKGFLDHLETSGRECGFKYLRFHGVFHEDMGVYTEDRDGNAIYNWQYVDLVYDSILDRGLKPFVELGFMPEAMANGQQTVFWWKTNVNPPKDYDKWYALVHSFVQHLEERYGRDEMATWYFEVWNEPNHPAFFTGGMEEYFKLYDVAVKAVKAVCNSYRVGGPATAAGEAWITEFIEHCYSNNVPVDFVSTHMYGVSGAFDEFGDSILYLAEEKDLIINYVKKVHEEIKASPMPHLEVHYTEWSSSYSSRDPVHDSYIQAPYILYNLKRIEGYVQSMSYWTFTDVFEEVGPPPSPFHGGFGLINLQSLKKPAFYTYKFLNELGDRELWNEDEDSWACKDPKGVQILFWDYTKPQQDECNQKFFKRDIGTEELEEVSLSVKGLPAGRYEIEVFLTGYSRNDVYSDYLKLGSPHTLSRGEVRELDIKNGGAPAERATVDIHDGNDFSHGLKMRQNDVYLVKVKRI